MKPNLLAKIGLWVLLFFCLSASAQQKIRISTNDIAAVLSSIETALQKKNVAAVVANFATNVVITAKVTEGANIDTTEHDKEDYQRTLESGFRSFDNYTVERKELKIELAADGQSAKSSSVLIEKFRFDGRMKKGTSKETAAFVLSGGKVLVTRLHSEIHVE